MNAVEAQNPLTFIRASRPTEFSGKAVSLFSGAGLGDTGIEAAGFKIVAQVESVQRRSDLAHENFPDAVAIAKPAEESLMLVKAAVGGEELDLLAATPPCQGMSSSNPSRGRRDASISEEISRKNSLLLAVVPYLNELRPKAFMAENVRQVLTLPYAEGRTTVEELAKFAPDYRFWSTALNVADYGVAQDRRRALIIGLRRDLPAVELLEQAKKSPWPASTHSHQSGTWVTVDDWFTAVGYESLDSGPEGTSRGSHLLHYVPRYGEQRYRMVSDIPAGSGRSAYENELCPECGQGPIALSEACCPACGSRLYNRPIVLEKEGSWRLIKGFKSSYRRMPPEHPAPTITTNTSHIGSDFKIHPRENRVLSPLECADLQTIPHWYDWSYLQNKDLNYLVRVVVGEAFPAYVVYRVALAIGELLEGRMPESLSGTTPARLGHRKTRSKSCLSPTG